MRTSNHFGVSHYGIQTIKMGLIIILCLRILYRELKQLELLYTLTIEAWLISNMHFDCRYLERWNACILGLVYIVLNVRDGMDSKYPSIGFLVI